MKAAESKLRFDIVRKSALTPISARAAAAAERGIALPELGLPPAGFSKCPGCFSTGKSSPAEVLALGWRKAGGFGDSRGQCDFIYQGFRIFPMIVDSIGLEIPRIAELPKVEV